MKSSIKYIIFALIAMVFVGCTDVPAGHVGRKWSGDGFEGGILAPGRHSCGPTCTMYQMETGDQSYTVTLNILCANELDFKFDVEVLVSVNLENEVAIKSAFENLQPADEDNKTFTVDQMYTTYVKPVVDQEAQKVVSRYETGEIVRKRAEIIEELRAAIHEQTKDQLAGEVALMGAMKHYFTYRMMYCCGINKVTLTGTPDDWRNIEDRVRALSEFGLSWWTDHLQPVVEQFRLASEEKPDIDFWGRIYLEHRYGSGSQSKVTGWINTLYPYVAGTSEGTMSRNAHLDWTNAPAPRKDRYDGPAVGTDADDFPFGLASVPVIFDETAGGRRQYNLKLYGGLAGVHMAEDLTVEAVSGVAIQNLGVRES